MDKCKSCGGHLTGEHEAYGCINYLREENKRLEKSYEQRLDKFAQLLDICHGLRRFNLHMLDLTEKLTNEQRGDDYLGMLFAMLHMNNELKEIVQYWRSPQNEETK